MPLVVGEVLSSPGRPLEPRVRTSLESRLGRDFSRVRVHTDGRAAESALAVNALAYTVGRDVVFGSGQYQPETQAGRKLLAHELVHVGQQERAGAPARPQASLVIDREDSPAEREAEAMAERGPATLVEPAISPTAPRLRRKKGLGISIQSCSTDQDDQISESIALGKTWVPRAATQADALAYTEGSHIVFGAGKYAPGSPTGRKLLAHELTHVVQQAGDGSGYGVLQRAPAKENSPPAVDPLPTGGAPLPYREATELIKCVEIMGKDNEAYCRQEVLGEPPRESRSAQLKAAARQQHETQQKRVADLIQKGLATQPASSSTTDPAALFRNSCEWIVQGRSTLVVLSQTHDSKTRKSGFEAYFDRQVKFPKTGGDYAEQPAPGDTDHIEYTPADWAGGMSGGELSLINPERFSDASLKETMTHEVQHAADQNAFGQVGRVEGTPGQKGGDALQSAQRYNDYQSEFRAYWLETPEGSPRDKFGSSQRAALNSKPVVSTDPATQQRLSVATKFKNERQEKIFWYLHNYYPGLLVAATYTQDPSYRAMVNSFEQPVGVNLVNSVRIQDLIKASEALVAAKGGPSKAPPPVDPGKVNDLFQKVSALDQTDRAFLEAPAGSQAFWDFAQRSLPFEVFLRLSRMFHKNPEGDFPPDPSWKPKSDKVLA